MEWTIRRSRRSWELYMTPTTVVMASLESELHVMTHYGSLIIVGRECK